MRSMVQFVNQPVCYEYNVVLTLCLCPDKDNLLRKHLPYEWPSLQLYNQNIVQ